MTSNHRHGRPLYSVHPGVATLQSWLSRLPQTTGRSLDQWMALVQVSGRYTQIERREWLQREYKLETNAAWWIAERAAGRGEEEGDAATYLKAAKGYVDAMYAGTGLRASHDELVRITRALGEDVKICPCKTAVPLYRNQVFAEIKPAECTRIDLGFALGDTKAKGRLVDTGGFARKDGITHRIPIASVGEIDAEVKRWLKLAYDRDA